MRGRIDRQLAGNRVAHPALYELTDGIRSSDVALGPDLCRPLPCGRDRARWGAARAGDPHPPGDNATLGRLTRRGRANMTDPVSFAAAAVAVRGPYLVAGTTGGGQDAQQGCCLWQRQGAGLAAVETALAGELVPLLAPVLPVTKQHTATQTSNENRAAVIDGTGNTGVSPDTPASAPARRRRAAQAVAHRLAQARSRDRHHRDAPVPRWRPARAAWRTGCARPRPGRRPG